MSKKVILIIDDDEESIIETLYKPAFEGRPIELIHKRSGPEAIELLQSQTIDMVFLDQVFIPTSDLSVNKFYAETPCGIELHAASDDPNNVNRQKQGLLILRKIRGLSQANNVPVIFVTAFAEDPIGMEALDLGANDYLPKDRQHIEYVRIAEKLLDFPLISEKEQSEGLLVEHYSDEIWKMFMKKQAREANATIKKVQSFITQGRRKGIELTRSVILNWPKDRLPTLAERNNISLEDYEWLNPVEFFQWIIDKETNIPKIKWEIQNIKDGPRLRFEGREGTQIKLLSIIKPKYSNNSFSPNLPLGLFDPYWGGERVAYFVDEIPHGYKPLSKYILEKQPISPELIQGLLSKIRDEFQRYNSTHTLLLTPESLFVSADGTSVYIVDSNLWSSLTDEGREIILSKYEMDKEKWKSQLLGITADMLLTGYPGGLSDQGKSEFVAFIKQCKSGEWSLDNTIPHPDIGTRFFHRGGFESDNEKAFFYHLKNALLVNNLDALVYLNGKIKFFDTHRSDLDTLVVTKGKVFWLDVKGKEFIINQESRNRDLDKIAKYQTRLRNTICKLAGDSQEAKSYADNVSAYFILPDGLEEELKNLCDFVNVSTFSNIIKKILSAARADRPYDLGIIENGMEDVILSNTARMPELSLLPDYLPEWISIGNASDPYTDSEEVNQFIEHVERELRQSTRLNCEYLWLPCKIKYFDYNGEEVDRHDKAKLRWVLSLYPKPKRASGNPVPLPKELDKNLAYILAHHYLSVLLAYREADIPCNIKQESLLVWVDNQNRIISGILRPTLSGEHNLSNQIFIIEDAIRIKFLRNLFNAMGKNLKNMVSALKTVSTASQTLREFEQLYRTPSGGLDKGMERKNHFQEPRQPSIVKRDHKGHKRIDNYLHPSIQKVSSDETPNPQSTEINKQTPNKEIKPIVGKIASPMVQSSVPLGVLLTGRIQSLSYSVEVLIKSNNKRYYARVHQERLDKIQVGDMVDVGNPKKSLPDGSVQIDKAIWILGDKDAENIEEAKVISSPLVSFGFIESSGYNYFFHCKDAIKDSLARLSVGTSVSFVLCQSTDGPQKGKIIANNVKVSSLSEGP